MDEFIYLTKYYQTVDIICIVTQILGIQIDKGKMKIFYGTVKFLTVATALALNLCDYFTVV